jgi:tetratricopeptide (TPR) repeat protein
MTSTPPTDLPAETIELLQVLGFLYLQSNRAHEAAVLLEAAAHARPCQGRAAILLALAQLRANAPERALSTLNNAGSGACALRAYGIARAQVLSALGRPREARQVLSAASVCLPSKQLPGR